MAATSSRVCDPVPGGHCVRRTELGERKCYSRLFALEPGDIIFTGTPSGVIIGMPKDKQVWPKAGDRIEGLGTLRFTLA